MMTEKQTILLQASGPDGGAEAIARAGEILRQGGTVAIPTETVYGLAADAANAEAVAAIFEAKGRPADNPLIVHIAHEEQLEQVISRRPRGLEILTRRFWPGPLTIICPKADRIPLVTSGGLDTVAVRMPSHPVARAIIEASVPLAAPSANRSGYPSPTTARHCVDDLWGRVDAIVDGGRCTVGVESTVISLCGEVPVLLRPGAVTLEQLREALGRVELGKGVLERLEEGSKVLSPGLKYKHYAPSADVELVRGDSAAYTAYVRDRAAKETGLWAMCFTEDQERLGEEIPRLCYGGMEDYAAQTEALFDDLRRLDALGARRVLVHAPQPTGMGLAVYNRLIRSAGFHITDV